MRSLKYQANVITITEYGETLPVATTFNLTCTYLQEQLNSSLGDPIEEELFVGGQGCEELERLEGQARVFVFAGVEKRAQEADNVFGQDEGQELLVLGERSQQPERKDLPRLPRHWMNGKVADDL